MQDDVNNYESKEEMESPKDHESPEIKNLAEIKKLAIIIVPFAIIFMALGGSWFIVET